MKPHPQSLTVKLVDRVPDFVDNSAVLIRDLEDLWIMWSLPRRARWTACAWH